MKTHKFSVVFAALFFIVSIYSCKTNFNDTALNFLTWVKNTKGDAVAFNKLGNKADVPINHQLFTNLLAKHVNNKGFVNYNGFQKDTIALNTYLKLLSNNTPADSWNDNEQLAYWINAYNAFTIKLVINNLPVESIKDIGGSLPMINSPWDIKFFEIGGVLFDLNTIEHQILRENFNEPRIHFAINCASFSCPLLINKAYEANVLNEQLNQQAKQFINSGIRNKISKEEAELSKIFDWFKVDFEKDGTLIEFINKHAEIKITDETEVSYLDYNWNLNKQ